MISWYFSTGGYSQCLHKNYEKGTEKSLTSCVFGMNKYIFAKPAILKPFPTFILFLISIKRLYLLQNLVPTPTKYTIIMNLCSYKQFCNRSLAIKKTVQEKKKFYLDFLDLNSTYNVYLTHSISISSLHWRDSNIWIEHFPVICLSNPIPKRYF